MERKVVSNNSQREKITSHIDNAELNKWFAVEQVFSNSMRPYVARYCETKRPSTERVLEDIFRQSFRFSNGSPILQSFLQIEALRIFAEREDIHEDQIAQIALYHEPIVKRFIPPKRHKSGKTMENWQQRLPSIWDFYVDIAVNLDDLHKIQPQDSIDDKSTRIVALFGSSWFALPYVTTFYLANAEQRYMEQGRPNRDNQAAEYMSHTKEYAIERTNTGNPEFNVVLAKIGAVIDIVNMTPDPDRPKLWLFDRTRDSVKHLAEMWENRHPGQSFLDNNPVV